MGRRKRRKDDSDYDLMMMITIMIMMIMMIMMIINKFCLVPSTQMPFKIHNLVHYIMQCSFLE